MKGTTERRVADGGFADSPDGVLTERQRISLRSLERYGWQIDFVRRPLFQDVVTVLRHSDSRKQALLDDDGTLHHAFDICQRAVSEGAA